MPIHLLGSYEYESTNKNENQNIIRTKAARSQKTGPAATKATSTANSTATSTAGAASSAPTESKAKQGQHQVHRAGETPALRNHLSCMVMPLGLRTTGRGLRSSLISLSSITGAGPEMPPSLRTRQKCTPRNMETISGIAMQCQM